MFDRQNNLLQPKSGSIYQITVKGELDQNWSLRFDGLAISSGNEETSITGAIIDQAALYGLLMQIRDLGLPLLSVKQLKKEKKSA